MQCLSTLNRSLSLLGATTTPALAVIQEQYQQVLYTDGKVIFALKGMCSHSLYHWIRIEKCANTKRCFEMCVCTLLNVNPVVKRVGAYALEGKKTAFVYRLLFHECIAV